MKRLVLFKGGVETLEYFTEQMSDTFAEAGYELFWCDLILQSSGASQLSEFCRSNYKDDFYLFTMNFEGIAGEEGYSDGEVSIWDEYNFKVVNMVVDHPLYYHKYIVNRPKRYIQINIDLNHVDYMRRFFSDVQVEFLMSAGTELNAKREIIPDRAYLPIKERPIDVIFTGNYTPKEKLRKHLHNMEPEYIEFYEEILGYLIAKPTISIEQVAEEFLKREFPDITDGQLLECMPNMMYVDLAVRFHFREQAIKALVDNGIKIHTFGDGYEYINCEHPENIIKHGGVDSETCLRFISQSKISLNVMPWFKRGAHDRVFNSMLNGAVCLTDSSECMDTELVDGKNALIFSLECLSENVNLRFNTDVVEKMLENDDKLQMIADKAYNDVVNIHTWKHRAKDIISIFDKII